MSLGDIPAHKPGKSPFPKKLMGESFSGKGHAAHICKASSPTFTRAAGRADGAPRPGKPAALPFGRERDDVAEKSNPRSPARGESIGLHGLFRVLSPSGAKPKEARAVHPGVGAEVDGGVCEPCGDLVYIKEIHQVSRTPPTVVRTQKDGAPQAMEPQPKDLAKRLKWIVHMLEIFWWGEDYCDPADTEPEGFPLWNRTRLAP